MDRLESMGLADAIATIKSELTLAQETATSGTMRMSVQSVTVELKVVATKTGEASVGFRVPVIGLELGAGSSLSQERTHTVTVVFDSLRGPNGEPMQVKAMDDEPGL